MLLPHARMKEPEGHLTQIVLLRPDVVDDDSPFLVQLLLEESSVEQAVRHEIEAALKIAGKELSLQPEAVAARVARDAARHALDLVHDLLGATSLGTA